MDKEWKVKAAIGSALNPANTHEFYVYAETLYDAFIKYYNLFGTKHLVKIQITEVKHHE